MKIVAFAGGVGGAKLAHGLAQILAPEDLTIIVNTGDDFEHLGMYICPDLDTVCYTLAGLANPKRLVLFPAQTADCKPRHFPVLPHVRRGAIAFLHLRQIGTP